RACQNFRLARNARAPFDSAHLQSLLQPSQQLRVLMQLQSERLGNHFPSDVIRRWTEAAGHKKNFATRQQFSERAPDRISVGHRTSFLDSQTQRKNLTRDKRQMRVLNVTQQKLGARIDESGAHVEK